MRSGPSAFTTRRVTRRQVKRAGGPSGISASTSTGSGSAKSRHGRGGLAGPCPDQRDAPASADLISCARSGIWLSREKSLRTAAPLNRLARRSISGSCLPRSPLLAKAVWAGSRGSVASAASTIRSTLKPTSMAQTLSSNRRARCDGSRHGALKPASMTAEVPSAR